MQATFTRGAWERGRLARCVRRRQPARLVAMGGCGWLAIARYVSGSERAAGAPGRALP